MSGISQKIEFTAEDERLRLSRRKFFFFGSLFLAAPQQVLVPESAITGISYEHGAFFELRHANGERRRYPWGSVAAEDGILVNFKSPIHRMNAWRHKAAR